jgi:hypothetical protein
MCCKISREELELPITYAKSSNTDLSAVAWKSLERYLDIALFTLKKMLWTSCNHGSFEVRDRINNELLSKLRNVLASSNSGLQSAKAEIAQIFRSLFVGCDRFMIFWETWKQCALTIQGKQMYEKTLNLFANDLESASHECKASIMKEFFQLMSTDNDIVSSRAKDISEIII